MPSSNTGVQEVDEIIDRIRATHNFDELARIVQELPLDRPEFQKAREVLEGIGYKLLQTKKGRYLPMK